MDLMYNLDIIVISKVKINMESQVLQLNNILYEHNFLSKVICRFDFAQIESARIEDIEQKLYLAIKDSFPERVVKPSIMHTTKFENGTSVISYNSVPLFEYARQQNKVVFGCNYIFLESSKYQGFEHFFKDIQLVIDSLHKISKINSYNRIGLRFINQIYLQNVSQKNLLLHFNKGLTGIFQTIFRDEGRLARQYGQVTLNLDGFTMLFSYGILNPDFPAKIVRNEFVLDYDCSCLSFEHENYETLINNMHHEIQNLFEKSISDKLRERMKGKNHDF